MAPLKATITVSNVQETHGKLESTLEKRLELALQSPVTTADIGRIQIACAALADDLKEQSQQFADLLNSGGRNTSNQIPSLADKIDWAEVVFVLACILVA